MDQIYIIPTNDPHIELARLAKLKGVSIAFESFTCPLAEASMGSHGIPGSCSCRVDEAVRSLRALGFPDKAKIILQDLSAEQALVVGNDLVGLANALKSEYAQVIDSSTAGNERGLLERMRAWLTGSDSLGHAIDSIGAVGSFLEAVAAQGSGVKTWA